MIDARTTELLRMINTECTNGSYKVLAFNELCFNMPKGYKLDSETLRDSLKELMEKQYINIKYEDEEEVCLCPLPKGRLLFENQIDENMETSRQKKTYFLYSFLGGFVGSGVVLLVFYLIWFFLLR